MTAKTAYLAFLPDTPHVGLDPHPAWAPQPTIASFDAAGYIEALGAETDRAALEAGIDDDEEDDADMVFEISVHDDGRIEVIHDHPRYTFAEFTIAKVYEAYGMQMPRKV